MTLTAAGFPGQVTDRQWSKILSLIGYEGTTGFGVAATSGDRRVTVASGLSNVGGVLAESDATATLQADPNPGSTWSRIDAVILRASWSSATMQLLIKQGTAALQPVPPTLTKTSGTTWELELAHLLIGPGQGTLPAGNVTDKRVPPMAGFYPVGAHSRAPAPAHRALYFHYGSRRLYASTGSAYYLVGDGTQETSFGHLTGVNFNESGAVTVAHGLGWRPDHMEFTPYLAGGAGGVAVFPSSISTRFTDTHVTLVAKDIGTGAPYTATISRIGFVAYRNL